MIALAKYCHDNNCYQYVTSLNNFLKDFVLKNMPHFMMKSIYIDTQFQTLLVKTLLPNWHYYSINMGMLCIIFVLFFFWWKKCSSKFSFSGRSRKLRFYYIGLLYSDKTAAYFSNFPAFHLHTVRNSYLIIGIWF